MQVSSLLFIFFLKVLHCFKFAIVPTVHFCLPRPHCCYCCSVVSDSLWPHGLQHARLPCPSHLPVCSNSCPFSQQWHPTISSSVIPSSCSQTFPASGSSPMSWLFSSSGGKAGASALASVLSMNTQGWFPLGSTSLISLLSKWISRVFSSTTFRQHQFFGSQLLYGPTHISIHDYWKNHSFDHTHLHQQSDVSAF